MPWSQVLVSKYADHLPLYRQAQIYARQGVSLDRSTLADWVGRAAFHLRPVHDRLLAQLKTSSRLFADETTAPVLDPGRGQTKTGQLFAYARDDRPWGGTDPPGVAYVYAPDRTAARPIEHLSGFAGVLQVDGYSGYRALAGGNQVTLAFCWAHTIRTQSSNWVSCALTSRRRAAQGNDMTDLQAAVVNDDAVDDQLQESLPVLKRGILQPDLNPLAERPQIGHHRLSLAPLVAQATLLLELKIQGMTLVGQLPATVLQFLQADHFRLVSIQQAPVAPRQP